MPEFDEKVLDVFLEKQLQLFPEEVAATREEAKDFLDECMAVVVKGAKEVWTYFDEEGVDISEMNEADILDADEVFACFASIHGATVYHHLGFVQKAVGQRVGIEARCTDVYPHKVCALKLGYRQLWQLLSKEALQRYVVGIEVCL